MTYFEGFRRNRRLVGLTLSLILVLGVASVALTESVYAARPTQARDDHGHKMASPFQKGMTFTITGSGTAFKINDRDDHTDATLSLTVKVETASPGRVKLNVTSGTLTIGSGTEKQTFTVKTGHGIINTHSMKMIIHAWVTDANGKVFHLVLFGKIVKPLNVQGFSVDFKMPQSKLAHKWFLKFQGAKVTRVS